MEATRFSEALSARGGREMAMKAKHPIIGFAGITLILIGLVVGCKHPTSGMILAVLGMAVLIYALVTGNIKFWG